MRYFTLPEEGVHGECFPMTFPPGKVCMGTSGNGRKAVFGRGFRKSYVRKFQNRPEGIKNPVQGLLVGKNDRKRGPKGYGQKNKGQKVPYSG